MRKLTEGNIAKTFLLYSIPLVLSGLISTTYGVVDTAIAGRFLGEQGLAAVGATSSFSTVFTSLFWGYSVGFSSLMARRFGAGDYARIKNGVCTYLLICGVIGTLIAATVLALHSQIFDLLCIEQELRRDALAYFSITFAFLGVSGMGSTCVFLLNAFGISSFTFWMSLLSGVINVVGNIVTVTVLNWGVIGIALSTVVASITVFLCYLLRLNKCFAEMGLRGKRARLSLAEIKESVPYGLPATLQQFSIYVANTVISPILNSTGSAAIASYVVANQIIGVNNTTYQNAARAVSNYGAQCMGLNYSVEEKRAMLKRGLLMGLVQGMFFISFILIPCLLFPNFVVSIFFSEEGGAEGFALARMFVRVFLPFILFNVVNSTFHAYFRGVKNMKYLVISTILGSAMRIVASIPLTNALGVKGFYIGLVIGWVSEPLFLLVLCLTGRWLPKELRRGKEKQAVAGKESNA